nr:LUD domain-containing protein [Candidatus Acidoferrales bacterium]
MEIITGGEKIVAQMENPGREAILSRIRAALTKPAAHHIAKTEGEIFYPVGDPLQRFQKECTINNTECLLTESLAASAAAIAEIISALPAGPIFLQDAPVLRRLAPTLSGGHNIRWSTEGIPAEDSQATITLADTLVAATGSIFVTSAHGGRGAAVVAPIHIVLAFTDQLVPDLEAAFARLYENGAAQQNSMVVLITGSSRTADIEKILVMGAHGPRRLIVALSPRAE